jgi:hypothetical protein
MDSACEIWDGVDGGWTVPVTFGQTDTYTAATAARNLRGGDLRTLALLWAAASSVIPADDRLARQLARKVFDLLLVPDWLHGEYVGAADPVPPGRDLLNRIGDMAVCFEGPDRAQARALFELVRHAVRLELGDNEEERALTAAGA